jgi:hypothetical protein
MAEGLIGGVAFGLEGYSQTHSIATATEDFGIGFAVSVAFLLRFRCRHCKAPFSMRGKGL